MKRVLSVLLSLTMLLVLLPAVAAGDGTGPYTVSLDGMCKAGEASVYVFLASETEKTYNAFWLTLAYDDSVLEFVGADNVAPQDVTRELKASARNGEVTVAGCGDYTFRTDPHYDYTFDVTVDKDPVQVQNNSDGSYTVKTVNGPLRITCVVRAPKAYPVTVAGSGKADVTAGKLAAYGQNFRFSVSRTDLTEYAVSAVVDGVRVELSREGDSYTIAGKDVTGPVTITVAKVTEAGTTLVLFIGSGAADVNGDRSVNVQDVQYLLKLLVE